MDTLYICSEPGCTYTHRRRAGGLYPSVVPTHHGKVMRQQEVPGDWVQITDIANHRIVVSSGGVLAIPLEAIEHEVEEERAKDPEVLVGYNECLTFSLAEVVSLYETLGSRITQIKREAPFVDSYHEQAANALLEAFAPQAEKLCKQGKYWWPEVRREAYLHLTQLMVEKSNEVINSWRRQSIDNEGYPRDQQEKELLRHFAVLYYQKYPVPKQEQPEGPEEDA